MKATTAPPQTKYRWSDTQVCKSELKCIYNWSDAMIRRYLGEPDRYQVGGYGSRTYDVHLYDVTRVESAIHAPGFREKREPKEPDTVNPIEAIQEASAAAHRWRDRAAARWARGQRAAAATASQYKKDYYNLKDAGIIAGHKQGLLRYCGVTPGQGLAVYEYGEGGRACFHSSLHPVGVARPVVAGHDEIISVPAQKQRLKLADVEQELGALPGSTEGYERGAGPEHARDRAPIVCFRCGGMGHMARDCWGGE